MFFKKVNYLLMVVLMNFHTVKFKFDFDVCTKEHLDNSFKILGKSLNFQLDNNLNFYHVDNENIYQFVDVSGENPEKIEKKIKNFFNFKFNNIIDVPLYKFLVLKNKYKFTFLAIIHSYMYDYRLINNLYKLFNNSNNACPENSFNSYLNSADYKKDQDYWEKYLLDIDEYTDIKIPRNQMDYTLKKAFKKVSIDLKGLDILDFCNKNNISPNVLFMSAVLLVLDKYTYSTKPLLTNIYSRKLNSQCYDTISKPFKEVPLIINRDNRNQSMNHLLSNVKNTWDNILKHDVYPFEIMLADRNEAPTITYGYFENDSSDLIEKNNLKASINEFAGERDIKIFFIKNEDGTFFTSLYFNTQLYTFEYMKTFVDSIYIVINQILNSNIDNTVIKDIALTNKTFNYNILDHNIPTLVELFEKQVKINSSKLALIINGEKISYDELNRNANKIANSLIDKVDSKSRIVVMLPRTKELVYSILGVIKAGCAFIPLDPSYPEDRINHIIADSGSQFIITDENMKNSLNPSDLLNNADDDNPDLEIVAEDLAYILYTSGTTGLPKGVCVSHQNIANIIMPSDYNWFNKALTGDVEMLLTLTAVNFTPSVIDFIIAFSSGISLVYANNDEISNINSLINLINEYKPEIIGSITPSVLSQFLEIPAFVDAFQCLKKIVLVGEKFPPHLFSKIKSLHSSIRIYNLYGSTETVSVGFKEITSDDDITIGLAIHNVEVYVVDIDEKILPVDVKGQLYVSGPSIPLGYTNEINSSYFTINNKSFFKTGDFASLLNNSEIKLWGRTDKQIKIRGQRVEPEEIITLLNKCPGISNSVVIVNKIYGSDHLIAYYVAESDVNKTSLENYLKSKLPNYMVPSLFIQIDYIPVNIHGKLDASKLPKPSLNNSSYESPSNKKEELVVDAFKSVFSRKIGVNDDFIKLGGTSLTAMRILTYLSDYNITNTDLLRLRTPKNIAANLQKFDVNWDKYSLDSGCPLSESQLAIYLDELKFNKKSTYNIPIFIKIPKKYTIKDIEESLDKIFQVHPIFKSHIVQRDDKLSLKISNPPIIKFLNSYDENKIKSFAKQKFDFKNALSRFMIVKAEKDLFLMAVFHHIIFDGMSKNIFVNDLFDILEGKKLAVDDSFLKIIALNETRIAGGEYDHAEAFYDSLLSDIDVIQPLLEDVNCDSAGCFDFDFDLPEEEINDFFKLNNISENVFFTSVFAYTLSRFTGDIKVLFNIIDHGRNQLKNYNAIGMFVNTLPIVVNCEDKSVSSFIQEFKKNIYNVLDYNFYPYRTLAANYNVNLWTSFQYQPYNLDENDNVVDLNLDEMVYGIEVRLIKNYDSYSLKILYSNQFSKKTVKSFAKTYYRILSQMIRVSELRDIDYLYDEDIKLLNEYNQTEHPIAYDDILDAFNDNLSKYPNSNLVSYNDVSYSYGEGAFIADKIAQKLIDFGVELQDCVGFLLPRSELYIFSVLGILSAGGVYVPLDDALPDERVKFILENSDCKVIIVSDETIERVSNLDNNYIILNLSNIINAGVGSLSSLAVSYGDLACILYTSGTTGLPKGVKITRKAMLNTSSVYCDKYEFNSECVYGMYAAIGFDIGSLSMATVLYSGASLAVIPENIKLNMNKLNEYFISHGVTHTSITAQVAKLFVQNIETTSLKTLSAGGEKLGDIESPIGYMLADEYGPTEAFAFCSSINNADKIDSSSIGRINPNMKFYILDNEFRRVPIGAAGELYLSGIQISQGYLNNEKETGKAFFNNPFDNEEDYNMIYRTGDMVRLLPDASLGIIDRRDEQVKIRGNRVELSEVESVIREIDYIEDVTVQTLQNGNNNELVAYIVLSNDLDDDEVRNLVRGYISKYKPNYMVPSFIVKLDEIPLTVNGKINKNGLPRPNLSYKNIKPQNDSERELLEICREILDNSDLGVCDDLLSVGFSSINYMNLSYRIYMRYKVNLDYVDLIECQNIRDIHNILTKHNSEMKFKKYEKRQQYPLTKDQIFISQLRIKNPKHIKPYFTVKIKNADVLKLKESIIKFMDLHPFLKSTFTQKNGSFYIKREDGADISNLIKITRKNKAEFDSFVNEINDNYDFLENYLSEGFTEYGNKFFYCSIVECEGNCIVTVLFDHLFLDYYSLLAMFNEIDKIYFNKENMIEKEIIDGFDYNMFFVTDEEEKSHLFEEFKNDLFDYGELHIPPIKKSFDDNYKRDNLIYILDDKESIESFCNKFNIKHNHFFMATFALALYKLFGLKKGVLPMMSNGRFFNEIKNTYHCIAKLIYLKFELYAWNCLNDIFVNISDEMKRIIKTEPNTFKFFYPNQWLFNFIEMKKYNSYLDMEVHLNLKTKFVKDHDENSYTNDVMMFETEEFYAISVFYLNKYYDKDYITEFLNCWEDIIKYIVLNGDLNMDLDFLEKLDKSDL